MKFGADDAPAGKPKGGALVALLGGGSGKGPDVEIDEEDAPVDHGFRAVAKAFGIPPEREAAAQAALHQYIKSCSGAEPDEDDLGGEEY